MKYDGNIVDGFMDGKGLLFYRGETKLDQGAEYYEGQFAMGQREGQGTYKYQNGTEYSGNWHADMPEGEGHCKFSNGNEYQGEWTEGKMNGMGTLTFGETGDVYVGRFVDNCMDGYGEYYHGTKKAPDSAGDADVGDGTADPATCKNYYKGSWKRDQRDGKGLLRLVTEEGGEDSYEGDWKAGQIHGKGRYVFANGKIYDGEWRADVFGGDYMDLSQAQKKDADDRIARELSGTKMTKRDQKRLMECLREEIQNKGFRGLWGVIEYPPTEDDEAQTPEGSVRKYVGEIKDEKPSGYGTKYFTNGNTFTGLFINDSPQGIGIMNYGQSSYVGAWKDGAMSGWGRFEFNDGSYYEGFWENGVAEGYGEHYYPDPDGANREYLYKGLWHKDAKDTTASNSEPRDIYDQPQPRGLMTITNKTTGEVSSYSGGWRMGLLHGQGELISGGFCISGTWTDGKLDPNASVTATSDSLWSKSM